MLEQYDKESVYDERIAPLMKQILQICKEENLPMVAQFYLQESKEDTGEPMYCTSVVIPTKDQMLEEAYEQLRNIADFMKYVPGGKPFVMTATITTQG